MCRRFEFRWNDELAGLVAVAVAIIIRALPPVVASIKELLARGLYLLSKPDRQSM